MPLLAYRTLRARPGRTLFTIFAIALGMALLFTTRIVSVAATQQALALRAGRLAGADLEIAPAYALSFPARLADELLRQSAIEQVAPIYKQPLPDSRLELLGVDPTRVLSPYELLAGNFLTADSEILLPDSWAAQHGLGVGQTVRLEIEGQMHEFRVVGLVKTSPFGTASAWLPLATLQRVLDRPGAATSILIRLHPNESPQVAKETLAAALGATYVVTSVQEATLALQGPGAITSIAFPFASVVVLLSGAYLIYNTFALTLTERKREIGQLRALGMTRAQVMTQTLTEALLMIGAGALVGLPLGLGMAVGLVRAVLGATPPSTAPLQVASVTIPLDGAWLAVSVGALVTLAATLKLAWAAGRVSPLRALLAEVGRDGTTRPSLYERWGGPAALGLLVLFWASNAALTAYFQRGDVPQDAARYTLLPLLALPLIALLAVPSTMRGGLWLLTRAFPQAVTVRLAADSIRKQRTRALLTSAMFTISLMLVLTFAGITLGFTAYFTSLVTPILDADFLLARPGESGGIERLYPPVPAELAADIAALGTEAQVFPFASTRLPGYDAGAQNDVLVAGTDYLRTHPLLSVPIEGSLEEAEQYIAAGPTLLLTEVAARRHDLHVGDSALISTLEGAVPFTVGLIHTGFTVIPVEYGPRYFGAHPTSYLVNVLPGQDKGALERRIAALVEKHDLQLLEDPEGAFSDALGQLLGPALGLFAGLTSLSALIASLNLINLLVASVLERQRELGTLRALGLTQRQLRTLVILEAGVLSFVGTLLGVLGALIASWTSVQLLSRWLETLFGPMQDAPRLPWEGAGLALVLVPSIAMLVALWPADRAASVNPAEAMRAEGATGFLPPAAHLGPTGLRGLVARLPLAARLSFTTGLVIVLTIGALTALRVQYERRLLEENMRAILARGLDLFAGSAESQLPAHITELTPALIVDTFQEVGLKMGSPPNFFADGNSPHDFTLRYFFIANNEHQVLYSNLAAYNGVILTDTLTLAGKASQVRITDWTGERTFEAGIALENQAGRPLGYTQVGFSMEPVDSLVRDIVRGSVGMMGVALVVATLLTMFFTRRALLPLSQMAEASQAVARGDLTQRLAETRWDEVGRVARAFNAMVAGLQERERLRDLFGRYLSREVGEAVLAGRVTLGGERKTITCLYVDMRGSTAFAEQYAPEEVMAALNAYFEVIIAATESQGGIVNRFVGDEAVCIFGAPRAYRDHADRALQAALTMRAGLAALNHKRERGHLPVLQFGMGLNSGEVVAGATGSETRQEYTMIGDAMNLGARIQALNKLFPAHDILLSEFTWQAASQGDSTYRFVDLGPVEIRGKQLPVRIFGLAGDREKAELQEPFGSRDVPTS